MKEKLSEKEHLKKLIKEHQRLNELRRKEQIRLEGLIKWSEAEIDRLSKLLYGDVFIENE